MTSADCRRAFALGLLLIFAAPAFAQVSTSKPVKAEASKPKKAKFKGEVLSMTRLSIIVRSRENTNIVQTFTYDKELAAKMAKLIEEDRAYQHGDRIVIEFLEGSDTAIKIKGKPKQDR